MRPIDLNNLVPNAQLTSKVQQIENNKQKHFVHNQTIVQNKKFERELKKVNTTEKAYNVRINKEQKGNKKNNYEKNENTPYQDKKDKKVEKEEKDRLSRTIGTKIDIKI